MTFYDVVVKRYFDLNAYLPRVVQTENDISLPSCTSVFSLVKADGQRYIIFGLNELLYPKDKSLKFQQRNGMNFANQKYLYKNMILILFFQ